MNKCPLCASPLSDAHYHRIIKIQKQKEKSEKGSLDKAKKDADKAKKNAAKLQDLLAAGRQREKTLATNAKLSAQAAKKHGVETERKRSSLLMKGMLAKTKILSERIRLMESGQTPQSIGLADEKVLVARLQKEFPEDKIDHEGKAGDVLHYVMFDNTGIGIIGYECKRTPKIESDHIQQAARDKKTRNANYGILVTTGTRSGFSGLDQESGIFIVAQAGVLTLSKLCRDSLVTMAKLKMDAAEKEVAAKRLMDYITSSTCKTPLEDAISHTQRAHKNLVEEIKRHIGDWKERDEIYQTIQYDVSHIKNNIARVLDGGEPNKLEKTKFNTVLALPKIKD